MLAIEGLAMYRGTRCVLDIRHLQVHPGERIALLGPSGSGKTTLLRAIAGLEQPTAGRIRLNGQWVFGPKHVPPAHRGISLLGQDYGLWPHLTAAQHIAFAVSRGQRIQPQPPDHDWLHRVELGHKLDAVPGRLSGGEQQRLALARALAVEPKLLLLDEPFANIDPVLSCDLLDLLDQIHRRGGVTRLMVTHDVEDAIRRSDRLLILNKGQLIQDGVWSAIRATPAHDWISRLVALKENYR